MENGSDGLEPPDATATTPLENGEFMAGSEEVLPASCSEEVAPINNVNGGEEEISDEADSSDCDALVIDESGGDRRPKKRDLRRKSVCPVEEEVQHSNPYFSESLFELSQLHQSENNESVVPRETNNGENKTSVSACKTHRKKGKVREYAQYLGLQPTVQFKCSKCCRAGFPSLATLNEHHKQCTAEPPPQCDTSIVAAAPSTNFRVTRKVFLCSACGTYYENWNLFLHMLEVHKRFICLYCLGMFSHSEKLSQHLTVKHSCIPGYRESLEDFFHLYKEPCFLMCCDCEKVFSEQDNFFSHVCTPKNSEQNKNGKISNNHKAKNKQQKRDKVQVEHVTADTAASPEAMEDIQEEQPPPQQQEEKPENNPQEDISMTTSDTQLSNCIETTTQDEQKYEDAETTNLSEENEPAVEPEDTPKETPVTPEIHNTNSLESSCHSDENQLSNETDLEDTRKVPKVTLKLPKPGSYPDSPQEDSDDSEKLTMEVDQPDSENETSNNQPINEEPTQENNPEDAQPAEPQIQIAGPDTSIVELELEQPLDKFDIRVLLQKCLNATVPTCIYCNHARKIAVNGKQLGLHAIAEHRFSAVVKSITAEELIPESFVARIKEGLPELEEVYFNLESSATEEAVTFSHVFECFQCRFSTTVHKELYLHNRKSHAKTILLCIMCKSVFYSYSELICHLCPGIYALENEVRFRCCMCISKDLPSAFRLLVHLRKKHHACDVCLELCHSQSRLSSHVWKHKLHHFCYRCGIAYRNKPDITKHLFWKHGTESVLCKRCLQKKWPHVYHFCIPPLSFTCEECNLSFTRAVSLKVHKRIHADEKPHACTIDDCTERFVSKKLLLKHEFKHREPPEEAQKPDTSADVAETDETPVAENETSVEEKEETNEVVEEKPVEKPKPKVDVYDLPELNLSESDSSDSENEEKPPEEPANQNTENNEDGTINKDESEANDNLKPEAPVETESKPEDADVDTQEKPVPILENVWDDFKNYQANKGKLDQILTEVDKPTAAEETQMEVVDPKIQEEIDARANLVEIIMQDHDYFQIQPEEEPIQDTTVTEAQPEPSATETVPSMDHDYFSPSHNKSPDKIDDKKPESPSVTKKLPKSPKKAGSSSSDSSSDSDSSSCTCGSNCSCSSSSGSSSSTSDSSDSDSSTSEGRRRQQARREKRKAKGKTKSGKEKESETVVVDASATDKPAAPLVPNVETLIQESDLETTESETDEDFYDEHPLKLASKNLAERRNQLLNEAGATVNGSVMETSRPSTPSLPPEETKPKKKSKSKKRKKKKSARYSDIMQHEGNIPLQPYENQSPTVAPLTLSIPRDSPVSIPPASLTPSTSNLDHTSDSDANLRSSKRRRVPNKFYGYSSDEDQDKPQAKWRKSDLLTSVPSSSTPPVVPPITIKTVAPPKPQIDTPVFNRNYHHQAELQRAKFLQQSRMYHQQQQLQQVEQQRPLMDRDSGTESNESSEDEQQQLEQQQMTTVLPQKPNQPALYCYCRCPYDEVSEMIGCDAADCAIEWFHFECVGIMVPPKGQWFCPDCRKKKQQRKE